jgi:hypothetical protein
MNVQQLVGRAVAEVHATGAPPAEVAPGVLREFRGSLSGEALEALLACGLAKMTADELAAERARKQQEEWDAKYEERRAEREREERQRRAEREREERQRRAEAEAERRRREEARAR